MYTDIPIKNFDFSTFWQSLCEVVCNFDLFDAIEIFILTFIFFFTFRFLKARKSLTLFIGILLCLGLLAVSAHFEFKVLESILTGIASSGVIVILIIFQPEIREALDRVVNGSLTDIMSFGDRKKKRELYHNVIENVCAAVKELSAESTGALIVIERTTELSDIAQTGITINADCNALLLRNLFYNKAPLHDGAIVIIEGKIASAGCFLPLTRRSDIDPDLGTRHRAALGMSESSDAIIIVVSEETGNISVAHDFNLNRNITVEELHNYLTEKIIRTSGNN
ncbi:MAG: diadenylate cyclase CdaA [Clostridia bacterium]|nr:diadenylate cyclase CdaA [Clostridia bacterium]